jgi:hypothetical protein
MTERAWTILITTFVLLVASLSILHLGPKLVPPKEPSGPPLMASGLPQVTQAMVPLVTGEEPSDELFRKGGCVICHAIPGIKGAEGRAGPKLVIGTTGPQRLADPAYKGEAKTVHDYVVESILTPGVFVVPGYPDHVMPRWYGQKLSATAVERMATYLEQIRDDSH